MSLTAALCTVLVLAAQFEEAPPASVEGPSSAPSSQPADTPAPSDRARRVREAVQGASSQPALPEPESTPPTAAAPPVTPKATPAAKPFWFERYTRSGPGHYLFYYAPDYASVAVLGGLTLTSLILPPPPTPRAAFGPSYDPASRDTTEVNSREYDRLLGGQHRHDTVPSWLPVVVGNAALLGVGAVTLARDRTFRKLHHLLLGAAQAQLATQLTTELAKSAFGRLRPDFRDRMSRYYCAPGQDTPDGVSCTAVRSEAAELESQGRSSSSVWIDQREFNDGRRSFPSGHATSAFSVATYFILFVGGEYVWGENSSAVTRLPGVAAQFAALTAALFVAGSRMTDNRHHPEDVLVGAGLGAGMSALFYFLHFDLQGRPIIRGVSFSPAAGPGSLGLNVRGIF